MKIEPLDDSTYAVWAEMRRDFWEDDEAKVREAYKRYKEQNSSGTAISFFAVDADGRHVGFLDAEFRTDYVDGAKESPIWYVEGIYVVPDKREFGIGTYLMRHFEAHVQNLGHTEVASACELGNDQSEAFHKSIGFREVIRSIHFVKRI